MLGKFIFLCFHQYGVCGGGSSYTLKGFTDCWFKILDLSHFESWNSLGFIPVIIQETDFLKFLFLFFFFFFHLLKLKLTQGVHWDMLFHPSKQCPLMKWSDRKYSASLPKVKITWSERTSTIFWEAIATKHLRFRSPNQFLSGFQHCSL